MASNYDPNIVCIDCPRGEAAMVHGLPDGSRLGYCEKHCPNCKAAKCRRHHDHG